MQHPAAERDKEEQGPNFALHAEEETTIRPQSKDYISIELRV